MSNWISVSEKEKAAVKSSLFAPAAEVISSVRSSVMSAGGT